MTSLGTDLGPSANWFLQRLLSNRPSEVQFRLARRGLQLALELLGNRTHDEALARLTSSEVEHSIFLVGLALDFEGEGYTGSPSFLTDTGGNEQERENAVIDYYDPDLLATLLQVFCEEAQEHLDSLAKMLEREPLTGDTVHEIYRGAHTLKGAAATVGLDHIAASAKLLEDHYHSLDDTKQLPDKAALLLTIMALVMFEDTIVHGIDGTEVISGLLSYLKDPGAAPKLTDSPPAIPAASHLVPKEVTYRDTEKIPRIESAVHLRAIGSEASLEVDETNFTIPPEDNENRATVAMPPLDEMQMMLLEVFTQEADEHIAAFDAKLEELSKGIDVTYDLFRITHTLKGAAATVGMNSMATAAHMLEDFFDWLRGEKLIPPANAMPHLYHTASLLRRAVTHLEDVTGDLRSILSETQTLCAAAVTQSAPATTAPSTPPQEEPRERIRQRGFTSSDSGAIHPVPEGDEQFASKFLKVPVGSIDKLIGNSEELTLVRTQIEKSRDEFISITSDLLLSHQTLRSYLLEDRSKMSEADRLERLQELEVEIAELIYNLEHSSASLTGECRTLLSVASALQNNLVDLRITTLELLFLKLKQTIREVAFQTGKEVEIITSGSHVEVDKGVVDNLSTPLVQIVRNCVTHGIEPPSQRKMRAKKNRGLIKIEATQVGNFAHIKVSDDGEGINLEAIKQKILEEGLIANLSDLDHFSLEEMLEAIFLPGFSTRSSSDNHSGRGIGLNLVREKIRRLGGEISVSTLEGHGSEFTVRVPITTFISQALLFQLGNEVYGIPISYVIELFEYSSSKSVQPGSRILWRHESIPVVPLHHYFGLETPSVAKPVPILVLSHGGKHFGITCDSLIGIKDVTVKPLGRLLLSLQYFSGAIVSGAGTVQLIFNIPYLAALARPALGFKIIKKSLKHVTSPKILVVDDSKSVREAASRVLTNAGYEVIKAQDGWEAWNILHEEEFDMVLTDLEMPRMNGYELITEIKRDSILMDIPVVVLSSRTGETSRKRVEEARANAFVSKPIKPLILLQVLQDFVPINEATMTRQILLFATKNNGKIVELQKLIEGIPMDIWSMKKFSDLPDVLEDRDTFEENAIKKAIERARQTGLPTLADDSGLEVDALDGRPGVHSARYGEEGADDRERVELLLKEMEGKSDRSARFVSVIAFCPNPRSSEVITVRGECEGTIALTPTGDGGFGYDPVFVLPDGNTMAELTLSEKNKVSHRAKAFQLILPHIHNFIDSE